MPSEQEHLTSAVTRDRQTALVAISGNRNGVFQLRVSIETTGERKYEKELEVTDGDGHAKLLRTVATY